MNDNTTSTQLSAPVGAIQNTSETASSAVAAQAAAIVQARYVVAMKNPRDIDTVREKLIKECKRPSFARVARYRKPIGKGIEGPSIRFAEAAIRCMGNMVNETTTLFDDREKRIVQVSITDLESNVAHTSSITIDKTVERKTVRDGDTIIRQRQNSYGDTVYLIEATEDNLLNKQNALVSKAVRTNGLRHIPGDIVDECMWLVLETQKNEDAKDPDAAKLQIFDAFGSMGVSVAQLKKYLGHDGVSLTPKELAELRGLYSAIKDGETSWKEVMDQREPDRTQTGLADAVDPKKQAPKNVTPSKAKTPDREELLRTIENYCLDKNVSDKALMKEIANVVENPDGLNWQELPAVELQKVVQHIAK